MSEREPGLYPVAWRRDGRVHRELTGPEWWPPEVLRWNGTQWRFFNGRECRVNHGPDWIGPRLDLPGDAP